MQTYFMEKVSTIHLFIKSLYESLTTEEEQQVKMLSTAERQRYVRVKNELKSMEYSPSQTSIDIILTYSKHRSRLDPIY